MRSGVVVALLGLLALNSIAAEPDPLPFKKEQWQKQLEDTKFHFAADKAGVMYSLSQCVGDCKIHMVYDPALQPGMLRHTFKFERNGKEMLTIQGHDRSSFQIMENVLYFAHFQPWSAGCKVTAHDLTTGNKLWETTLNAVGCPPHSVYQNEVTLNLSYISWIASNLTLQSSTVLITGRESAGDYIEILDRGTGKVLAHKIYRNGFAAPKQP